MKNMRFVIAILLVAVVFFGVQYLRAPRSSGGDDVIVREAIAFYQKQNPGVTNLSAKVINFGCHFEVDVQQQGKSIARLGWAGPGQYYVIR